jgi:hypothetical protein
MIAAWAPRGIEYIATEEGRRLIPHAVPGLSGDLHHDLGRSALAVRISGTLHGDEARDSFLAELREKFNAGEAVDFIADIVAETELEQVLIRDFRLAEVADHADSFHYDIVLVEYTEPPEPPTPGFGPDLDLGLDIDLGLDLLDLPGLLGDVPDIGPLLEPVRAAADELGAALSNAGDLLSPLGDLFE